MRLFLPILLSLVFGACAQSVWLDEFTSIEKDRWDVFGKVSAESGQGLVLGSSEDVFGCSGIRTRASVGRTGKPIRLSVEFDGFKVTTPAPREGTNAKYPIDISINFQLSGDPEKLFYDSDVAGLLVSACYSAEKQALIVTVRGKDRGRAGHFGDNVTSTFVKADKEKTRYKIVLEAGTTSIDISCFADGEEVWNWMGNGPAELGGDRFLKIYQQNILSGRGTVMLRKAAVESADASR